MPTYKNILVTGGAGFIGANFVHLLYKKTNAKIIVLDKLTYAGDFRRLENLNEDKTRVAFVRGDICNYEGTKSLFTNHKIDAVVHFAAESHVDRSIHEPDVFLQTNVNGTVNLLKIAKEVWAQNSEQKYRFIHVSTDEVYRTLKEGDEAFTEHSPYRPNSPYSASKAFSDLFVRAWVHTYGFPAIITNCSNNYVPWQFPEKLLPLMIQNVIEKKSLPVYGDGRQIRDWIHVEDHCQAIFTILQSGRLGETYLISADQEKYNIDIVHRICDVVDQELDQELDRKDSSRALIVHVKDRPGHDRCYAINSWKLQSELGWKPTYRFEDVLPEYVRWTLAHQEWIHSVRDQSYLEYYEKHYGNPEA